MTDTFSISSYEDYLTAVDVLHNNRLQQELAASYPCGYCDRCGLEIDSTAYFCEKCHEVLGREFED